MPPTPQHEEPTKVLSLPESPWEGFMPSKEASLPQMCVEPCFTFNL